YHDILDANNRQVNVHQNQISGWIYGKCRTRLSVENLNAIAQLHSYYIANNKSELSFYEIGKSVEDIQQILTEADLYEDIEEITFEQVIANVDLDMIDNDDNSIAFEEDIVLEETLNLSELQFLPEESEQNEIESNNDMSQDLDDNWLIDFEKEDDYDP
ncbi:16852_t:CDS:1, partial [Racocetra fulgida]